MFKKSFLTLACAISAVALPAQTAEQVHADYVARRAELNALQKADSLDNMELAADSRNALEFLYAYMTWPDVADYSISYHQAQAECALRAREEMPWGKSVPQREWTHFVLPVRINNENLDAFRTTCYNELRDRVNGLTMRQAVYEVNHWCHEYVTYKPSDSRTSSPLASMKTSTGRCGEESTFTVAALRAVGIPARQVYTPRWAHTDDNHAWVEAWVDGTWYFLGACEPEPVLNLGWFNLPASRGMLMHTKVFGRYDGPEDVIDRTLCYTEINVTDNYAETARTTLQVVDAQGKAVPGAKVEFKIYNYGELYTVQSSVADKEGRVSILTGLGDMVAWAVDGGHYGFTQFTAGGKEEVKLRLSHKVGESFTTQLTLVPPVGKPNIPEVSPEAQVQNALRLAHEDSIRTAYVHTFADSSAVARLCEELKLEFGRVWPLSDRSRGNWQGLFSLLRAYPSEATLSLLETLTDKDLRDFSPATLADFAKPVVAAAEKDDAGLTKEQRDFKYKYVYCPRVANEMLSAWYGYFQNLPKEQKQLIGNDPAAFAGWIKKNISSNPERNPLSYTMSPAGSYSGKRADVRNKGILFVAACRAMGVPARIDEVTEKVQYFGDAALYASSRDGVGLPTEKTVVWRSVSFADRQEGTQAVASPAASSLSLSYTPREHMENPAYYTHFTLSRMADGLPQLQNYPEDATWEKTFKDGADIDAGDYLLCSGTRLADGTVLAQLNVFSVEGGGKAVQPLVMREDNQGVQVIGSFNAENLYYDIKEDKVKSVLSTTGRGYYVTGLIRANHEPTNHILHDIEKLRSELEAWGRPILLIFSNRDEYDRFLKNSSEFTNLPSTLSFGIDTEGAVQKDLFGGGLTQSRELPFVVIADTFNRVVFSSQGYTIGLGERIKNIVGKLR